MTNEKRSFLICLCRAASCLREANLGKICDSCTRAGQLFEIKKHKKDTHPSPLLEEELDMQQSNQHEFGIRKHPL